jgi:predicted metallopeptidase
MKSYAKHRNVEWNKAPDVKRRVLQLSKTLNLDWVRTSKIYCFRSKNSKSFAHARIWGLSKIWQKALKTKPAYVVEVLSEKFDKLSQVEQDKVLLHELAHIPKNFSGSLLPHIRKRGKRNFDDRVRQLVSQYMRNNFEARDPKS